MKHANKQGFNAVPHRSRRYQERGSASNRRRGHGMELVPSRRTPPKNSMLAGLAATVKGKAALMQEDAKGKVRDVSPVLHTNNRERCGMLLVLYRFRAASSLARTTGTRP